MATFKMDLPEGGFLSFDAPDNASDAELQAAAGQRYAQHQKNLAKETAKMREDYDPVKDMSGFQKVAANLGAGASNLIEGAANIPTKLWGSDADKKAMDADVIEKRQRDEALAQGTTGGSALQLAGEILPTLLVPAGGLARGAGAVLTRTLGERAGGAIANRLGMRALSEGGSTVADAALSGGLSGGLSPTTSDESALGRAAMGAVLGGAVPWAGAQIGRQAARLNPFGKSGSERLASEQIAEALGRGGGDATDAARTVADQIRSLPRDAAPGAAPMGGAPGGIPLSTAAQLGNEHLAWLEVGNRARNAANWSGHDTAYAEGLANALRGATQEGADVAARRATRNANFQTGMAESLDRADPEVFATRVQGLRDQIEGALRSPEAVNPRVRALYTQMQSELDRLGDDITPAHVQQMRANFNEKASAFNPNPSAYASAPRESVAVGDTINTLDDILNETTGGHWDTVRGNYARDARALDQAKAAQRLHESFYTPTGEVRGVAAGVAGDLPKLSEAQWISRTGGRDANLYSTAARDQIDAITNALRAQNLVQRVKTSGTGGGGSATAPTLAAMKGAGVFGDAVANAIRSVPIAGHLAMGVRDVVKTKADAMLADALQNPQTMLRLLERLEASGQPLTEAQRAMLTAVRGGTTFAANAVQP